MKVSKHHVLNMLFPRAKVIFFGILLFLIPLLAPGQSLVADFGSESFLAAESEGSASWPDNAGNNNALGVPKTAPTVAPETTPTGRKALSFDGNQFLHFPPFAAGKPIELSGAGDMTNFSTAPNFSLLAVVKIEGYAQTGSMTILGGYLKSIQYAIASGKDGGVQSLAVSNFRTIARSTTPVPTSAWAVIGVAYDGKTASFYQDGELTDMVSTLDETFELPTKEVRFRIGTTMNSNYFIGLIAALRIYEGVLSEADMKQNSFELMKTYIQNP